MDVEVEVLVKCEGEMESRDVKQAGSKPIAVKPLGGHP